MGDVTGGPVQSSGGEQQLVREVSAPLFAAKGWMKFLGILMIIYGVLTETSIPKLYLAGFLPGLVLALLSTPGIGKADWIADILRAYNALTGFTLLSYNLNR